MENQSIKFIDINLDESSKSFLRDIGKINFKWSDEYGTITSNKIKLEDYPNLSSSYSSILTLIEDYYNARNKIWGLDNKTLNSERLFAIYNNITNELSKKFINSSEFINLQKIALGIDIDRCHKDGEMSFEKTKILIDFTEKLFEKITEQHEISLIKSFSDMVDSLDGRLSKAGKKSLSFIISGNNKLEEKDLKRLSDSLHVKWIFATDIPIEKRWDIAIRRCEAMSTFPSLFPAPDNICEIPGMKKVMESIDKGNPYIKDLKNTLHISTGCLKSLIGFKEVNLLNPRAYEIINSLLSWNAGSDLFPRNKKDWFNSIFIRNYSREMLRPDILNLMKKVPSSTRAIKENGVELEVQCDGWSNDLSDCLCKIYQNIYLPIVKKYNVFKVILNNIDPIMNDMQSGNKSIESGLPNMYSLFAESFCNNRSPQRIVELLWKVHHRLGDLACIEKEYSSGISSWPALSPETSIDNYQIVPLISTGDLILEGSKMHHCVGSYTEQCINGNSHIFSFRVKKNDESVSVATVEISCDKNAKTNKDYLNSIAIRQVRGAWNRPIKEDPETFNIIKKWISMIRNNEISILDIHDVSEFLSSSEKIQKYHKDKLNSIDAQEMDRLQEEKYSKIFPIFWDIMPGSKGSNFYEWIESSDFIKLVESRFNVDLKEKNISLDQECQGIKP